MTRTSTARHTEPPTGRIWCSWRTRRSFAWSAGDTSPISSRKIVPPSASAKSPGASPIAPVKAPRTCPKSSLSSSVSVSAPQSTATNGRLRRGLFARLARIVDGARDDRLHRRVDRPEGGHDDDREIGEPFAQPAQQGEAVHLRHLDVEDGEVDRLVRGARERPLRVGLADHGVTVALE